MCSACGFPSRPGHWTDAGVSNPGGRLRLRFTRLAIVNRLLTPYRLRAYDDGSTPGLQLMAPGGERVLVPDLEALWKEAARIAVHGQPVFAVAQPGGRRVWVNFAFPDNDVVQVIDTAEMRVLREIRPGRAVLHLEFTPRGEQAWISSRDDGAVVVYDTASFAELARLKAESPSGIFLAARAFMTGF